MNQLLLRKTKPTVSANGSKSFIKAEPMPSLALCLVMDFLGYATYAIPFLGEFLDILWAPVSAFVFMKVFGGKKGLYGGIFNFVEELMPGLDFIPTFTLTWIWQYFSRKKNNYTIYSAKR